MNLDDKIKQALKMEDEEVEQVLAKENGILDQVLPIFRNNMRRWNVFGILLGFITAAFMLWTGYHFFISDNMDDRMFWGVLALAFLTGNMGIKIWFWMEMNRHATQREIKRLELAITQLSAKLTQDKATGNE